jgi:hypothetical protein
MEHPDYAYFLLNAARVPAGPLWRGAGHSIPTGKQGCRESIGSQHPGFEVRRDVWVNLARGLLQCLCFGGEIESPLPNLVSSRSLLRGS